MQLLPSFRKFTSCLIQVLINFALHLLYALCIIGIIVMVAEVCSLLLQFSAPIIIIILNEDIQ